MGRRSRPTHGRAVRSRITRLKAYIPSLTIDAIHGQLEAEGLEISRSFVGKVIKEWQNLDENVKWLEFPFDRRLIDRAGVPWEASRFLLDCQRFYESEYFREGYESPRKILLKTLTGLGLLTRGAKVTKPVRYSKPFIKMDPFTNHWACWSWRVQLAAPNLEPELILPIARIYAAFEQLASLVTDKPTINLTWLDTCLWELPPFEGVPLPKGGLGENTADIASKLIELMASAMEAGTNRVLKNSGEFPTWRKEEVK
jgi:hypothetical protein